MFTDNAVVKIKYIFLNQFNTHYSKRLNKNAFGQITDCYDSP